MTHCTSFYVIHPSFLSVNIYRSSANYVSGTVLSSAYTTVKSHFNGIYNQSWDTNTKQVEKKKKSNRHIIKEMKTDVIKKCLMVRS